jgi:outer membrane protein assembly factor BamD
MLVVLAGCAGFPFFGGGKITEEAIIAPEVLYSEALEDMDAQRYNTAVDKLEKLQRQHPYSDYVEKAKLMEVYAHYRIGQFDEAIMAADRYLAIYPQSSEAAYILYLKGNSYFGQIRDITRDQQIARNAIDTYTVLINTYPNSEYVDDARDNMVVAYDQLAGKEMSVGRYYLGNGQYMAGINRFRVVVEQYQTSTHIEEALYRLTEGYLALGLLSEARTAAAVLGHNYPSSTWYSDAVQLLERQGLVPQMVQGNWIAQANR